MVALEKKYHLFWRFTHPKTERIKTRKHLNIHLLEVNRCSKFPPINPGAWVLPHSDPSAKIFNDKNRSFKNLLWPISWQKVDSSVSFTLTQNKIRVFWERACNLLIWDPWHSPDKRTSFRFLELLIRVTFTILSVSLTFCFCSQDA